MTHQHHPTPRDDGRAPFRSSAAATIRLGTAGEALAVLGQLPEFVNIPTAGEVRERTQGRFCVALVACDGNRIVGAKLGYGLDGTTFYSWLGGVVPDARSSGVARTLLYEQQRLVRAAGYTTITVKSMNRYPAMLRMLIAEGYRITGTEGTGDALKVLFEYHLG